MPIGKDGKKLPYKGEPGYEEAKAANPEAYANEDTEADDFGRTMLGEMKLVEQPSFKGS